MLECSDTQSVVRQHPGSTCLFREMLSLLDVGLRRELQSILTIYLSLLLQGYSSGFSAVALPDIKDEMERR